MLAALVVGWPAAGHAESRRAAASSFSPDKLRRVGGTFFFIDPRDDMFAIFMVQAPSQNGRIQLALRTLIYQALDH